MRRRLTVVLAVWLVALAASLAVRRSSPQAPPELHPPDASLPIPAVLADGERGDPVRVVYRDVGSGPGRAVLLLHGSPGSRADFRRLFAPLAESHRVVAPDLPGFGASERDVPDYSIRAHAVYAADLLDRLGIERAHVVGFSMGGGVAIELYHARPDLVASVTLLSAIGVQELELFGDYRLNHIVHGAQLAALWFVEEGLPHFGAFDDLFFGTPYARNFYDTDQRPLRGILRSFRPPMLILHGESDALVSPAAAREHARIVPQAELRMLDDDHFMVFRDRGRLAGELLDFFGRVESGEATTRASAPAARVAAASSAFDPSGVPPPHGIALALILVAVAVATLVSEDLTCVFVGLLVGQGRLPFVPGVLACFAGIFLGDMLLFAAGRWVGRPALARAPLRWLIQEATVERASRWFNRRGPIVIALSRFVPGMRLPTYFAAGTLRTSAIAFALYFALAVAVWTPILVGVSAFVGERAFGYVESFQRHLLPAALLLALWIVFVVRFVLPAFTWQGRRRLAGLWRRWTHWEFWPLWLFYAPVACRIVLLGLRHRSPLLFTAANPAIEASGFIAESKHAILSGLGDAGGTVAKHALLPGSASVGGRLRAVGEFRERHGLDYPLVLKPDAGQRGSGVAIVRAADEVRRYLESAPFDTLVQEYAPGDEFGVFYVRRPGEARGRIFSITEKRMPEVVGDGRSTLERLILADRRAVALATHYLQVNARRLDEVPPPGARVRLVELGTHCRGAIFLDGGARRTEALERRIDEISRGFEGFYFGRYDLRTTDLERFAAGQAFKIIELNGVTSEATHIYDPDIGLLTAWRTLFEQWRLAFEIGAANRRAGTVPIGLSRMLELVREYRRIARDHPA